MSAPKPDSALRYPVGRFTPPAVITAEHLAAWRNEITALPELMRHAVAALSPEALDTPYRPGGWTVRQVVHHLPDSHLNCYVRFRWALTEEHPTIKAYDEARWAELPDAREAPVSLSLDLLTAVHARWVALLERMTAEDYRRGFEHPESGPVTLAEALGSYAWHGRHHLAHVRMVGER